MQDVARPEAAFLESLVARIHASPAKLVLAVTGGASGAISSLLTVPGASRSVLEAIVPYSAAALDDWLGARPESYCSERTARAMAMAAFERARDLGTREGLQPESCVGVAATASLASDRPKRGAHRIHAASQTVAQTSTCSLTLCKGLRSRRQEEDVAAAIVLNLSAVASSVAERLPLGLLAGESLQEHCAAAPESWQDLLLGRIRAVVQGTAPPEDAGRRAIFPGAFNPLHAGHRRMAQLAGQRLSARVEFEISIANVDKPLLDYREMELRAAEFSAAETLWFTRAATFVEKAEIFPRATFVVGADTMQRIANPQYYGDSESRRDEAVAAIAGRGCRFLVFGRCAPAGFQTLCDLRLPPELASLCEEVAAADFREDVSSTQIRRTADSESE